MMALDGVNSNIIQPVLPQNVNILLSDKKGCKRIYDCIVKNSEIPTSQYKWAEKLILPESFN